MTPPRKDDKSPPPATTNAFRTAYSDELDGKRPRKNGAHHTPMPKPAQNRKAVAKNTCDVMHIDGDGHGDVCGKVSVRQPERGACYM